MRAQLMQYVQARALNHLDLGVRKTPPDAPGAEWGWANTAAPVAMGNLGAQRAAMDPFNRVADSHRSEIPQ